MIGTPEALARLFRAVIILAMGKACFKSSLPSSNSMSLMTSIMRRAIG